MRGRFGITADRLIAVSRGGAQTWYSGIASRYFDVLDWTTQEELRSEHYRRVAELGEQKQRRATAFDERLIDRVRERVGSDALLLHPSSMYELMSPYWYRHLGSEWIFRHAQYSRLAASTDAKATAARFLPSGVMSGSYVAVKFYFNDCFPDAAKTRGFVQQKVRELSAEGTVVALPSMAKVDDHEVPELVGHEIITVPNVPAEENLAVQSAIVSGARAFVGTYGGFAYLAPFLGVAATTYYVHEDRFSARHLAMAQAALASLGNDALLTLNPV